MQANDRIIRLATKLWPRSLHATFDTKDAEPIDPLKAYRLVKRQFELVPFEARTKEHYVDRIKSQRTLICQFQNQLVPLFELPTTQERCKDDVVELIKAFNDKEKKLREEQEKD